jgi:hypothetical protein
MLPGIPEGECAWTCAFKQAPEEGRWRGWPVVEDRPPSELTVHNNYFCVASVKLPEGEDAGEAPSRKKSSFGRLFVAPIDDIVGGLPLPPSCILQTSPNKRQAFYRLDPPIDNPKVAECLMKELIRSGRLEAADKGGCNIIRYMRLPVGCNSKASHVAANGGEPSLVRLVEWHPERGYSLVELVEGFALDRDYVEGRVQRSSEKRRKQAKEAASNNILAALKAKGLYRLAKGDGVHEILCPWAKAHTSGDGGTAYFQPSEENPRGGFKCQHGHCADRHLKDLCAALGVESPAEEDESGRPLIFLRAGARNEIIAQVERTFADNDQVFARSGTLVKPTLIKVPSDN